MEKPNHNSQNTFRQAGFNLIELLVVISIIALIVSAALLLVNSSRQKSRNAKRVQDIKQMIAALDLFYAQCNSYPIGGSPDLVIDNTRMLFTGTSSTCGTKTGSSSVNGGIGTTTTTPGGKVIVRQFISAPMPPDGTCTPAQNSYTYNATGVSGSQASGFTISFCLGVATGGYPAGPNTVTR